jgi:hypothetical protein
MTVKPISWDAVIAGTRRVKDLTPAEEAEIKTAIENAMTKVDDALRVVLALVEEIESRKQQEQEKANAH